MNNSLRSQISQFSTSNMLENKLGITKKFCFSSEFKGFSGHFPGYPILPAFIQLVMIQMLYEEHIKASVCLQEVRKAKFMKEILPDQKISVLLKKHDSDEHTCIAQVHLSDQVVATKCILSFLPLHDGPDNDQTKF